MFQMTTVVPQTHLEPTSKVVSHPDKLFLPDGTHLLGDGHFQFSNGLRTTLIHMVLQEPPEIKHLVSEVQRTAVIWNMCSIKYRPIL